MIFTLSIALSQPLVAQTQTVHQIDIAYPHHQEHYTGSIRTTESELMEKLVTKASTICGSKDRIEMIENVEAKFTFSTINIDSVNFQGSYPLSSVTATIHCQ